MLYVTLSQSQKQIYAEHTIRRFDMFLSYVFSHNVLP